MFNIHTVVELFNEELSLYEGIISAQFSFTSEINVFNYQTTCNSRLIEAWLTYVIPFCVRKLSAECAM